jgi:hypothetical protein
VTPQQSAALLLVLALAPLALVALVAVLRGYAITVKIWKQTRQTDRETK